jgi:hypothetical protein
MAAAGDHLVLDDERKMNELYVPLIEHPSDVRMTQDQASFVSRQMNRLLYHGWLCYPSGMFESASGTGICVFQFNMFSISPKYKDQNTHFKFLIPVTTDGRACDYKECKSSLPFDFDNELNWYALHQPSVSHPADIRMTATQAGSAAAQMLRLNGQKWVCTPSGLTYSVTKTRHEICVFNFVMSNPKNSRQQLCFMLPIIESKPMAAAI